MDFTLTRLGRTELEWVLTKAFDCSLSQNIAELTDPNRALTIWDVGAHVGDWTRKIAKSFPEASFVLFEANHALEGKLAATGWPHYMVALSESAGRRPFYAIGGTGDSFYQERTNLYEEVVPPEVVTTTLDILATTESLGFPDLLKVDTQGSELDILEGAQRILPSTRLVYLECPLRSYNHGAPHLNEYVLFMEAQGFLPFSIHEIHNQRSDRSIVQIDILFYNHAQVPE